jgi:hypothetical protein
VEIKGNKTGINGRFSSATTGRNPHKKGPPLTVRETGNRNPANLRNRSRIELPSSPQLPSFQRHTACPKRTADRPVSKNSNSDTTAKADIHAQLPEFLPTRSVCHFLERTFSRLVVKTSCALAAVKLLPMNRHQISHLHNTVSNCLIYLKMMFSLVS